MTTLTTAAATSAGQRWEGGRGTLIGQGTFGSGTLTIEGNFDGSNWITLLDPANATLSLTAEGAKTFEVCPCQIRGVLAGSTGATVVFDLRPMR